MAETNAGTNTVTIRVRGSQRASLRPERATVHARIALEGPEGPGVMRGVEQATEQAVASIRTLHDPEQGPVTWFAVHQVRTSAHRPWNDKGKQLPVIHTATVSLEVKFSDFAELARWVAGAVSVPGFRMDQIAWSLTEKRRVAVEDDVRREAVRDARTRAQSYADALDLGQVQVRQISDPGLMGETESYPPVPGGVALRGSSAGESDLGAELTPRDIVVSAEVEAEFVVVVQG